MKKLKIVALALVLAIAIGTAYAATTSQKISFILPNGYLSSMIPPYPSVPAKAEFEGNLLTKPGGVDLTTLNGKLTVTWPSGDETYSLNIKPSTLSTFTSGGGPGCAVVCHQSIVPVQIKYEGTGSNARDGAGSLSWIKVENLPVPPATRYSANLYGQVVSKDQAYWISLGGSNTPTIQ